MSGSTHDLIVIGSGIAGLAASRCAARLGLRVANLECLLYGGLITNVNELEGEITGSGAELAGTWMGEAMDLGVEALSAQASGITAEGGLLTVHSDGDPCSAPAVIVASGARLRAMGVPGEEALDGRGVSHCADCDGPLYQGQDVAVVGGGDSACQEALVLAAHCRHVHLVHRSSQFRAREAYVQAVRSHPGITVHLDTQVQAVLGEVAVTGLRLRAPDGTTCELSVQGVFPYVGLEPVTDCVPAQLPRAANGALEVDDQLRTPLPGLYAVGAVRAGFGGRLVDAVADGEAAARHAAAALGRQA